MGGQRRADAGAGAARPGAPPGGLAGRPERGRGRRTGHGAGLAAGGSGAAASYLAATELYDPAMDAWSSGPDMPLGRDGHTVTRLATGKVLAIGGYAGYITRETALYPNSYLAPHVGGPYIVAEGGAGILQARASDPEGDGVTTSLDVGGDGQFETAGAATPT